MSSPVRILRLARADLDAQAIYYEDQQQGLGDRFLTAAEKTIAQIGFQPESSGRYGFRTAHLNDVRVRPVKSFPRLLVFYRVAQDQVEILRVLHASRKIEDLEDEILPE